MVRSFKIWSSWSVAIPPVYMYSENNLGLYFCISWFTVLKLSYCTVSFQYINQHNYEIQLNKMLIAEQVHPSFRFAGTAEHQLEVIRLKQHKYWKSRLPYRWACCSRRSVFAVGTLQKEERCWVQSTALDTEPTSFHVRDSETTFLCLYIPT